MIPTNLVVTGDKVTIGWREDRSSGETMYLRHSADSGLTFGELATVGVSYRSTTGLLLPAIVHTSTGVSVAYSSSEAQNVSSQAVFHTFGHLGTGEANTPPIANAGIDRDAIIGDIVTLAGAALDAETANPTATWEQIVGPTVELRDAVTTGTGSSSRAASSSRVRTPGFVCGSRPVSRAVRPPASSE